ncbi:MAG TPA: F0F1 ATP synthase subunit delta [Candidatus Omnitrophota bacterium]|nr:F0F1 ATP synthase subunit delta [Candidatus Omnitrophota bacterium]HPT07948.1 F0F1 ATP synthase subunit delta [Candidatus Omnitrophota bacterium]
MLIFSLILMMLVVFGVLIFFLQKILKQNLEIATKHLDELKDDYEAKEKHIVKQSEEAMSHSQEIIAQAQDEAQKLKEQILQQAEAERESVIKQARSKGDEMIEQAEKSRHALLAEIEDRIAKGAVEKACELVNDVLPENVKRIVHEEWLDDLINNGFTRLSGVSLPSDVQTAKVVAAFALSDENRSKIVSKLKTVLGRDIVLTEEINPHFIAGFVITIGSLVLDGSLQNKIKEKAR